MKKWSRKSRSYCRERVQEKSPVEKSLDERKRLMEDFVLEMARHAPDGIALKKEGRLTAINMFEADSFVRRDSPLRKILRENGQMIVAWLLASKTILMDVREGGFFCCLSEDGFNWAIEIEDDRKQEWMEANWEQEQAEMYASSVSEDEESASEALEFNKEFFAAVMDVEGNVVEGSVEFVDEVDSV